MRVIVLGRNGMLGRYVYKYLSKKYDVIGTTRKQLDVSSFRKESLGPPNLRKGDVVINCIGLIKQRKGITKAEYIAVNSLFPNIMADYCAANGLQFIHVTTDCVYDGITGGYNEGSVHNATDLYGVSKSMGEPANATVVRTSIIGEEIKSKLSLLEWVRSNSGNTVMGYTNHIWNGITCLQFAKVCDAIIEGDLFWKGVRHVTSPSVVSKYELVHMISNVFGLNVDVKKYESEDPCDRSLTTEFPIMFNIPELRIQMEELKNFSQKLRK